MKALLLSFALLISAAGFAQKATTTSAVAKAPAAAAPVKFAKLKHNFGNNIKLNAPATYTFSFTNTGTKALIIESAVAGCGCTTPVYPKAPIAKGKKGDIKVTYNSASVGTFSKTVTVKFLNITEPVILTIEGEVKA